jgi:uncharacterized protein YdhG (YjbR/CyaY superfamily)
VHFLPEAQCSRRTFLQALWDTTADVICSHGPFREYSRQRRYVAEGDPPRSLQRARQVPHHCVSGLHASEHCRGVDSTQIECQTPEYRTPRSRRTAAPLLRPRLGTTSNRPSPPDRTSRRQSLTWGVRRAQPNRRMKTEQTTNIADYIAGFPQDVQARLQKMRRIIRKAAPDAEETIKYRIPTFVLNGNLVHFAAFPKHIGLYPTPSAIKAFSAELAGYRSAKGSVQFPLDKPVPVKLIERMVEFRVRETREKIAAKKSKK